MFLSLSFFLPLCFPLSFPFSFLFSLYLSFLLSLFLLFFFQLFFKGYRSFFLLLLFLLLSLSLSNYICLNNFGFFQWLFCLKTLNWFLIINIVILLWLGEPRTYWLPLGFSLNLNLLFLIFIMILIFLYLLRFDGLRIFTHTLTFLQNLFVVL